MISETLKALLKYSKSGYEVDMTWSGLRANVLGDIYHYQMSLKDVMTVVFTAYSEAAAEPRFELADRHQAAFSVLMDPLIRRSNPWSGKDLLSRATVEEFYDIMLAKMMVQLRFTRVDWCRPALFPDRESESESEPDRESKGE